VLTSRSVACIGWGCQFGWGFRDWYAWEVVCSCCQSMQSFEVAVQLRRNWDRVCIGMSRGANTILGKVRLGTPVNGKWKDILKPPHDNWNSSNLNITKHSTGVRRDAQCWRVVRGLQFSPVLLLQLGASPALLLRIAASPSVSLSVLPFLLFGPSNSQSLGQSAPQPLICHGAKTPIPQERMPRGRWTEHNQERTCVGFASTLSATGAWCIFGPLAWSLVWRSFFFCVCRG
jgi:hypothetical protein